MCECECAGPGDPQSWPRRRQLTEIQIRVTKGRPGNWELEGKAGSFVLESTFPIMETPGPLGRRLVLA